MTIIHFPNQFRAQILEQDGRYQGLGEIRLGSTLLRSAHRPMNFHIHSPDGVTLSGWQITDRSQVGQRTTLEFSANRCEEGIMEWMVHEVRNRQTSANWNQPPTPAQGTSLWLDLEPVDRIIGSRKASGMAYRYRYASPDIAIYKILDRATWEPGGRAVGTEFWMRNCFAPSTVSINSVEQFHSTEWYLPSCANPNIFQFLPLQTELQGFTFTASPQGVLVTWSPEVFHIRSLFEKPRGEDAWVHLHEHCADLSLNFIGPRMEVLFIAGSFDQTDLINLYEDVRRMVHQTLHQAAGIEPEPNVTFGMIEEWDNADMEAYRTKGIPKLAQAGVEVIGMGNHFSNNMNTYGVSNFCCTVDHRVAESVGADKFKAFCDDAGTRGMAVEMWGNTALSALAWLLHKRNGQQARVNFADPQGSTMEQLSKCPDPFVRNASNAIEADHYTPSFLAMNLRSPVVMDHLSLRWKELHEQIGITGIFLDSSFNLSSDKFHWIANTASDTTSSVTPDQMHLLGHYRPAKAAPAAVLSQYHVHLQWVARLQQIGIHYSNEDLGVFGIHRHGPGVEARRDCLHLWSDCRAVFDVPALEAAGADVDAVFFQGLAYRMVWTLHYIPKTDALSFNYGSVRGSFDLPGRWHLAMIRAYRQVHSRMVERHVLPGQKAIVYRHGAQVVIWATENCSLHAAQIPVTTNTIEGSMTQSDPQVFDLNKHSVITLDFAPEAAHVQLSQLIDEQSRTNHRKTAHAAITL